MRIITTVIWMFLILYLPEVIGLDKNIYFYLIAFPISLIGVFVIQHLFDEKLEKNADPHNEK